MTITHGSSQDHRPDLQQVVLALLVSPDGGVPCVSHSGEGQTADSHVVQERAQALMTAFEHTPSPRELVADATRSHADHAPHLQNRGCITRIPHPLGVVSQVSRPALTEDTWQPVDDTIRAQCREVCPDGMAPRWPYHQVASCHLTEYPRDAGKGRPTPRTPRKASAGPIQAHVRPADEVMGYHQHVQAGCVLGTTISASEVSDPEVIAADTRQARVEGGFRWLKDPRCCVSALCVQKPSRSDGRWMVMPLAWLVSSVTQRRLRQP
jgi:hypothetical protein